MYSNFFPVYDVDSIHRRDWDALKMSPPLPHYLFELHTKMNSLKWNLYSFQCNSSTVLITWRVLLALQVLKYVNLHPFGSKQTNVSALWGNVSALLGQCFCSLGQCFCSLGAMFLLFGAMFLLFGAMILLFGAMFLLFGAMFLLFGAMFLLFGAMFLLFGAMFLPVL